MPDARSEDVVLTKQCTQSKIYPNIFLTYGATGEKHKHRGTSNGDTGINNESTLCDSLHQGIGIQLEGVLELALHDKRVQRNPPVYRMSCLQGLPSTLRRYTMQGLKGHANNMERQIKPHA